MRKLSNGRRAQLVAAAILIGFVSAAGAATRYMVPGVVSITTDSNGNTVVQGTLGEVRNSADNAHYITCLQTRSEVDGVGGLISRTTRVTCGAANSERSVMCLSNSEALADALIGATNDALLEIHISGIICTEIVVYESSSTIRKAP